MQSCCYNTCEGQSQARQLPLSPPPHVGHTLAFPSTLTSSRLWRPNSRQRLGHLSKYYWWKFTCSKRCWITFTKWYQSYYWCFAAWVIPTHSYFLRILSGIIRHPILEHQVTVFGSCAYLLVTKISQNGATGYGFKTIEKGSYTLQCKYVL